MFFTFALISKGIASLGCFEILKIPGTNFRKIGSKNQKFLHFVKFSGQRNIDSVYE